ncbi:MAG TPA: NADH-quinone oxidoreductase subunit J [Gemmatimonadales bacterium]|nr:NADH-quinone oxidoreductase subunit J [Gemmatimonadales bacterium]
MSPLLIAFWGFAVLAVITAGMCITRRSPLASALWLIVTMFCLAVLFTLLDAPFIGVLQVLVYAGAIMVLFLFVIMLLGAEMLRTHSTVLTWQPAVAGVL